jgi:hypothetical protein
MTMGLALLIQPFAGVLLFAFALWIARKLFRKLPDGRLRRFLFSPIPGHKPRRWG